MAVFGKMELTEKGSLLLNKVITRKRQLEISRVAVGSGEFTGDIWKLTSLVSNVLDGTIVKSGEAEGQCEVEAVFTNEGVTEDFAFREIGVFALDPDDGEVLYAYANSGENCDYISVYNGSNLEEEKLNIKIYTAGTSNVYAEIIKSEMASQIGYDDSTTNINSDNVQTAIENIVGKVNDIDIESKDKDGGNADMVDGYHASEFTKYREFNSLDELAETQYEGLFYIGGSEEITGISLKSGRDIDVQPDNTDFLEIYTRIYSDKDGKMYAAADVYSTEYDFWTRKSLKTFSFDGHPHSVSDIEDFPKSLPASGGNADTVDGKHASDLQDYNNLTNKPDFHILTNKTTFDIPEQGLYQVKCADNNSPNGKNGIWSLLVIGDGTGGFVNVGNNYITQLAFYRDGMTYTRDCYMTDNEDDDTVYNWSEWRKINDGGNADTVDGKHASDFALKNHSHTNFSAWDSDLDSDTSWGVSISASGINFQWNDDTNDSELHISENGLMGGGSFLPAVSNFGNISAESFSGNGSNLTNVNADTISGIGIDGIQTKQTGMSSYTDWNDIVEPGFHKLMERGTENAPDNSDWFFPIVFACSSSGITQLAAAYRYDWIYMRHKKTLENGTIGWTEWRKIGGAFEQTVKTGGTDLNTLHGSTELYNLQGDFTNGPDGVGSWGSLLSLYGTGSGKTIQVYFPDTGNGAYIRRCKVNGSNWNEWVNIGDSGNAKSVNKKTKNFTVQTGSWFRLARNNKDSCGGVFVLTVGSGSSSSTTVFSASQQYSSLSDNTLKLKCLSHSHFNNCVTKLRLVHQSGSSYEQYIDFYIAGGTNGLSGDAEVQFFGKGWIICDSIESSNIASGYTATEISL